MVSNFYTGRLRVASGTLTFSNTTVCEKKGDPFKYLSAKMTPFNIPNSFPVAPCSEYENIYSKEHIWSTFCSCLRLSYVQAL